MKKTIITLGTGAGYASPERGGAANLVLIDDQVILLDCGEGAAGWINKLKKTNAVSVIFISHMHADHIAGLFVLLQNMKIQKRNKPLEIFLPQTGINDLERFLPAVYLDAPNNDLLFTIRFKPVDVGTLYDNKLFKVNAWMSDHFVKDVIKNKEQRPAFGFTIVTFNNEYLIYSGDIASIECIIPELQENSILICETTHPVLKDVIEIAKQKHLKSVVFTHIAPDFDLDEKLINMNDFVFLANDGQLYNW